MSNRVSREKPKPKDAMSSYACFVQVIKEEHKKKHPDKQIVFNDFSKKCAEQWKLMTDEEKHRFKVMSEMDRNRHIKEMDEYNSLKTNRKTKKRRTKDPNEPKRAWSAFFFYSNEFRPLIMSEHPEWKVGDVAKELGRRWELCEDKEKYEEMARSDKERYVKDMENFKAGIYVPPKMGKSLHGVSDNPPPLVAPTNQPSAHNNQGHSQSSTLNNQTPSQLGSFSNQATSQQISLNNQQTAQQQSTLNNQVSPQMCNLSNQNISQTTQNNIHSNQVTPQPSTMDNQRTQPNQMIPQSNAILNHQTHTQSADRFNNQTPTSNVNVFNNQFSTQPIPCTTQSSHTNQTNMAATASVSK